MPDDRTWNIGRTIRRAFAALLVGGALVQTIRIQAQPTSEPGPEVDEIRALPYLAFSKKKAEDGRTGVLTFDRRRSSPGYNLYSNRNLCLAELIDPHGDVVRSWRDPEPCRHWSNTELLADGDLLVAGMAPVDRSRPGGDLAARFLLRMAWNGDVIWRTHLPAHHDAELTPRNRILTLTMGGRSIPAWDPAHEVRDNDLVLLSPRGTVLERRSLFDLLSANAIGFELQRVAPDKGEIDLFHANSVEWMHHARLRGRHPLYDPGNVLVSIRHQDTIAVIDWHRRTLVWAWGRGEISGPHDATVLDNGHILLFDNGLARGWSRVIELDPMGGEIAWEYRAPNPTDFFTASRGASQRLANGNTLITNSDSGQVFEVTPRGEIVWEFVNTHLDAEGHCATIVRMKRYEKSFFDNVRKSRRGRSSQ